MKDKSFLDSGWTGLFLVLGFIGLSFGFPFLFSNKEFVNKIQQTFNMVENFLISQNFEPNSFFLCLIILPVLTLFVRDMLKKQLADQL